MLKHFNKQMSAGHLLAASQQGHFSLDALMPNSAFATCALAIPADIGKTSQLATSSTAKIGLNLHISLLAASKVCVLPNA